MTEKEILSAIDYLYRKYEVSNDFYILLSEENKIRAMKGILAELDKKKKAEYSKEDIELIKDIYFMCC